ncbi:hypothetical protein ACHAPJ_011853 [Fusarium lateritium]
MRMRDRIRQLRAEDVERKAENRRRTDARRAHMTPEEIAAEIEEEARDRAMKQRNLSVQTSEWIADLVGPGVKYGYVIYQTKEAQQRPSVAGDLWFTVFNESEDDGDAFPGYDTGSWNTVHDADMLSRLMLPSWETPCPKHGLPSQDRASAFREYFQEVATPRLPTPRMLTNTFLVLQDDFVFREVDTKGLEYRESIDVLDDSLTLFPDQLPKFYLWAYDGEWQPPSTAVAEKIEDDSAKDVDECSCRGTFLKGHDASDEDGYQGRVKVKLEVLFTWPYYARTTGIDHKDMWEKAQTMPNQTWTCGPAALGHAQPAASI